MTASSPRRIVGVVGDVRPYTLRDEPVPMVFFPIRQWPSQPHNLAVRVSGDVSESVAAVRAALQRAEPGLVLDNVGTMALQVERNVLRERLVTYLASAFGALSLLLGCVGLYGVSVLRGASHRGVRGTTGARRPSSRPDTRRVSRGAWSGGRRSAVGLLVALWASRLLEALLFEVTTFDPVVAIASAGLLIAATLAASYLPARRAGRVNPIAALKTD